MQTRVKFVPNMSRWVVQVREDNQWLWRTCRHQSAHVSGLFGNEPIFFLTHAEGMEYIEKISS